MLGNFADQSACRQVQNHLLKERISDRELRQPLRRRKQSADLESFGLQYFIENAV